MGFIRAFIVVQLWTSFKIKYPIGFRFLLLVNLFFSITTLAQDSSATYEVMTGRIQHAFNAGQPEKIYELTSENYQSRMAAGKFATGMNAFRAKTGNWKTYYTRKNTEKGWDYLAEFEFTTQLFSLKLDQQGKIERMNFSAIPTVVPPKTYQVASNNPLADSLDWRVEQQVRPYIQKGISAGMILAIIDHGRIRRYSYGTVDKAYQQLPDAEKSIFEIGSVTKTFTSLVLAQLVIDGQIGLNDPINKHLPDSVPSLNFQGKPIRLVHLANHTAGFPRLPANIFSGNVNPQNPYQHYNADSLYRFLVDYRPTYQPGTLFSYSNYGAGLLGAILEKQLQMDFSQLVVEKIGKPLRMDRTFVKVPLHLQADFAQGYDQNGQPTSAWDLGSLKGSGAVRSTLNDMIRYIQAQLGMKNPLRRAIALSHQVTFPGPGQMMGLAWRINKAGQYTYYHHSGGTGGFRSFVGFDVDRQRGIIILSNTADEVTAIGESLLSP